MQALPLHAHAVRLKHTGQLALTFLVCLQPCQFSAQQHKQCADLADNLAVDDRLVARLDGGAVRQNADLRRKLVCRLRTMAPLTL